MFQIYQQCFLLQVMEHTPDIPRLVPLHGKEMDALHVFKNVFAILGLITIVKIAL